MSRHPEIKWAQRSEHIFLSVELPDAKDPKVTLEPEGKFSFSAGGPDNELFEVNLDLLGRIKVEESKVNVGSRHVSCIVKKEEKGWWKRLLKEDLKPPYLKVDWDKWVDEDEEGAEGSNFDKIDFSGMDDFSV